MLRMNGGVLISLGFPFMLRLSKHSEPFFSNLLLRIYAVSTTLVAVH